MKKKTRMLLLLLVVCLIIGSVTSASASWSNYAVIAGDNYPSAEIFTVGTSITTVPGAPAVDIEITTYSPIFFVGQGSWLSVLDVDGIVAGGGSDFGQYATGDLTLTEKQKKAIEDYINGVDFDAEDLEVPDIDQVGIDAGASGAVYADSPFGGAVGDYHIYKGNISYTLSTAPGVFQNAQYNDAYIIARNSGDISTGNFYIRKTNIASYTSTQAYTTSDTTYSQSELIEKGFGGIPALDEDGKQVKINGKKQYFKVTYSYYEITKHADTNGFFTGSNPSAVTVKVYNLVTEANAEADANVYYQNIVSVAAKDAAGKIDVDTDGLGDVIIGTDTLGAPSMITPFMPVWVKICNVSVGSLGGVASPGGPILDTLYLRVAGTDMVTFESCSSPPGKMDIYGTLICNGATLLEELKGQGNTILYVNDETEISDLTGIFGKVYVNLDGEVPLTIPEGTTIKYLAVYGGEVINEGTVNNVCVAGGIYTNNGTTDSYLQPFNSDKAAASDITITTGTYYLKNASVENLVVKGDAQVVVPADCEITGSLTVAENANAEVLSTVEGTISVSDDAELRVDGEKITGTVTVGDSGELYAFCDIEGGVTAGNTSKVYSSGSITETVALNGSSTFNAMTAGKDYGTITIGKDASAIVQGEVDSLTAVGSATIPMDADLEVETATGIIVGNSGSDLTMGNGDIELIPADGAVMGDIVINDGEVSTGNVLRADSFDNNSTSFMEINDDFIVDTFEGKFIKEKQSDAFTGTTSGAVYIKGTGVLDNDMTLDDGSVIYMGADDGGDTLTIDGPGKFYVFGNSADNAVLTVTKGAEVQVWGDFKSIDAKDSTINSADKLGEDVTIGTLTLNNCDSSISNCGISVLNSTDSDVTINNGEVGDLDATDSTVKFVDTLIQSLKLDGCEATLNNCEVTDLTTDDSNVNAVDSIIFKMTATGDRTYKITAENTTIGSIVEGAYNSNLDINSTLIVKGPKEATKQIDNIYVNTLGVVKVDNANANVYVKGLSTNSAVIYVYTCASQQISGDFTDGTGNLPDEKSVSIDEFGYQTVKRTGSDNLNIIDDTTIVENGENKLVVKFLDSEPEEGDVIYNDGGLIISGGVHVFVCGNLSFMDISGYDTTVTNTHPEDGLAPLIINYKEAEDQSQREAALNISDGAVLTYDGKENDSESYDVLSYSYYAVYVAEDGTLYASNLGVMGTKSCAVDVFDAYAQFENCQISVVSGSYDGKIVNCDYVAALVVADNARVKLDKDCTIDAVVLTSASKAYGVYCTNSDLQLSVRYVNVIVDERATVSNCYGVYASGFTVQNNEITESPVIGSVSPENQLVLNHTVINVNANQDNGEFLYGVVNDGVELTIFQSDINVNQDTIASSVSKKACGIYAMGGLTAIFNGDENSINVNAYDTAYGIIIDNDDTIVRDHGGSINVNCDEGSANGVYLRGGKFYLGNHLSDVLNPSHVDDFAYVYQLDDTEYFYSTPEYVHTVNYTDEEASIYTKNTVLLGNKPVISVVATNGYGIYSMGNTADSELYEGYITVEAQENAYGINLVSGNLEVLVNDEYGQIAVTEPYLAVDVNGLNHSYAFRVAGTNAPTWAIRGRGASFTTEDEGEYALYIDRNAQLVDKNGDGSLTGGTFQAPFGGYAIFMRNGSKEAFQNLLYANHYYRDDNTTDNAYGFTDGRQYTDDFTVNANGTAYFADEYDVITVSDAEAEIRYALEHCNDINDYEMHMNIVLDNEHGNDDDYCHYDDDQNYDTMDMRILDPDAANDIEAYHVHGDDEGYGDLDICCVSDYVYDAEYYFKDRLDYTEESEYRYFNQDAGVCPWCTGGDDEHTLYLNGYTLSYATNDDIPYYIDDDDLICGNDGQVIDIHAGSTLNIYDTTMADTETVIGTGLIVNDSKESEGVTYSNAIRNGGDLNLFSGTVAALDPVNGVGIYQNATESHTVINGGTVYAAGTSDSFNADILVDDGTLPIVDANGMYVTGGGGGGDLTINDGVIGKTEDGATVGVYFRSLGVLTVNDGDIYGNGHGIVMSYPKYTDIAVEDGDGYKAGQNDQPEVDICADKDYGGVSYIYGGHIYGSYAEDGAADEGIALRYEYLGNLGFIKITEDKADDHFIGNVDNINSGLFIGVDQIRSACSDPQHYNNTAIGTCHSAYSYACHCAVDGFGADEHCINSIDSTTEITGFTKITGNISAQNSSTYIYDLASAGDVTINRLAEDITMQYVREIFFVRTGDYGDLEVTGTWTSTELVKDVQLHGGIYDSLTVPAGTNVGNIVPYYLNGSRYAHYVVAVDSDGKETGLDQYKTHNGTIDDVSSVKVDDTRYRIGNAYDELREYLESPETVNYTYTLHANIDLDLINSSCNKWDPFDCFEDVVGLPITVTSGGHVVDLNGYFITGGRDANIPGRTGTGMTGSLIDVTTTGELTIDDSDATKLGGYIDQESTTIGSSTITTAGEVVVDEGTVMGGQDTIVANDGSVIVNDGTVINDPTTTGNAIEAVNTEVTVNDGAVTGTDNGIKAVDSTVTVNDGAVTGKNDGINVEDCTTTVNGGDVIGSTDNGIEATKNDGMSKVFVVQKDADNDATVTGKVDGINAVDSLVTVNGGTVTGSTGNGITAKNETGGSVVWVGETNGIDSVIIGKVDGINGIDTDVTVYDGLVKGITDDGIDAKNTTVDHNINVEVNGGEVTGINNGIESVNNDVFVTDGLVHGTTAGIDNDDGWVYVSDGYVYSDGTNSGTGIDGEDSDITVNGGNVYGYDNGINAYAGSNVTVEDDGYVSASKNGNAVKVTDSNMYLNDDGELHGGTGISVNDSYAKINGGYIEAKEGSPSMGIYLNNRSNDADDGGVLIEDCDIDSDDYGIYVKNGYLYMKDGTVSNISTSGTDTKDVGIFMEDGEVYLEDGLIEGWYAGVHQKGGKLYVLGDVEGIGPTLHGNGKNPNRYDYNGLLTDNGTTQLTGGVYSGITITNNRTLADIIPEETSFRDNYFNNEERSDTVIANMIVLDRSELHDGDDTAAASVRSFESDFVLTGKIYVKITPKQIVAKKTTKQTIVYASESEHVPFVQGFSDGTFLPDGNITRAQVAAIFARLLSGEMTMSQSYPSSFSDVEAGQWYSDYIGYLEGYDVINGYTDGTFQPDKAITRAEFVSIVARYMKLTQNFGESDFTDVDASHWALGYINAVTKAGYVNGYTDGTFCPDKYITRAEVVTVVCRMLQRTVDATTIASVSDFVSFPDVPESHWAYYYVLEGANDHLYTNRGFREIWYEIVK